MGGGHTVTPQIAAMPATPTRSDSDTQALAAAQAQRYANPNTFVSTMLAGPNGANLGTPTGAGSALLGG